MDTPTGHLGLNAVWLALLLPLPYVYVFVSCVISRMRGVARVICSRAWLTLRYIVITNDLEGHGLLGYWDPTQETGTPCCPLWEPTLMGPESRCLTLGLSYPLTCSNAKCRSPVTHKPTTLAPPKAQTASARVPLECRFHPLVHPSFHAPQGPCTATRELGRSTRCAPSRV